MDIQEYNTFKEFKENYLIDFNTLESKPPLLKYLFKLLETYKSSKSFLDFEHLEEKYEFIEASTFEDYFKLISIKTNKVIAEEIYLLAVTNTNLKRSLQEFLNQVKSKFNSLDSSTLLILEDYYELYRKQQILLLEFENQKQNKAKELDLIIEQIEHDLEAEKLKIKGSTPTVVQHEHILDYSDNSKQVQIIHLDQLGVLDFLKQKLRDESKVYHLSTIVSAITGINVKTVNSMLTLCIMNFLIKRIIHTTPRKTV